MLVWDLNKSRCVLIMLEKFLNILVLNKLWRFFDMFGRVLYIWGRFLYMVGKVLNIWGGVLEMLGRVLNLLGSF